MGLFSSKKKTYVSSTVYNLAGDINDRVKYLTTVVMSYVLRNDSTGSLGSTIVSSLLSGPGIKFRSFGRWARTSGYSNAVGQNFGTIQVQNDIDTSVVIAAIPRTPEQDVSIQTADVDAADYTYWVDQWMLANHPTEVEGDYETDIATGTNEIYITFADGRMYSFFPVGYDPLAQYLYASYTLQSGNIPGPIEEGAEIIVGSPAGFPSTSGASIIGSTTTPGSATLTDTVTTEISYSDGRPGSTNSVDSTAAANWNSTSITYRRDTYQGQDPTNPNQLYTDRLILTLNTTRSVKVRTTSETDTEIVDGNVTKTTKVTTRDEYVDVQYSYKEDTQKIVVSSWSGMKVFIYQQNTGNPSLDALFNTDIGEGRYFPYIPIYINNRFVTGDIYDRNVKAVRKAMNTSYTKLEDSLKANDSLGDIDYAYIVFGVPLNTKEEASRKYLFRFFENMLAAGSGSSTAYNAWRNAWSVADASKLRWIDWRDAQANPLSPLYGKPAPVLIPYPKSPGFNMTLLGVGYNFHVIFGWIAMAKFTNTGLGRPGAKKGDCWAQSGPNDDYEELLYSGGLTGTRTSSANYISYTWQVEDNQYQTIGIWGAKLNNRIYKNKGIDITGREAMADTEESGFIIPLNEAIYRQMPLLQATQMATSMGYMMLNSYKVVKQKWYASSWFKIVLIIVAIVITVVTAGSGAGASAGLLGTAAGVGTALGFAGVVAVIVGTIANAIAAMILSQIIMMASTAIFGEKVGAIVGAIASVIAVSVGTGMANGGGVSAGFSNLSSAEGLMQLTVAAGKGLQGYLTAETNQTLAATQELMKEYESKSQEIQAMTLANFGQGKTYIDPTEMTDFAKPDVFISESPTMFLGRTLMTGTDIADTTSSMLTNFAAITTSTTLPA